VRFATGDELERWDSLQLASLDGGDVWRSREYAEQKRLGHYTPRFLVVGDLPVVVHEKRIPLWGRLWYLPKGPGVHTLDELETVAKELGSFARTQGAFMLKLEPRLTWYEVTGDDDVARARASVRAQLGSLGWHETLPVIPNASTVLVPLLADEHALLASLGQKARYAINRARRDGVTVERVPATDANCQLMYELLAATADGAFGIRSREYYVTFWKRFEAAGMGQLFFAYFEGQLVAAAFAMVFGGRSTYKDGASLRKKTSYGASHLMQWEVMRWAVEHGSEIHDLCGAPPSDEIANAEHPFYGIGLFKTSFSPTVTDYIGVWDVPLSQHKYRWWIRLGERAARRLSLIIRKDPYY
jgi:lipid II:glycine glycyltransferase (peptidoglycan interpeptide bridge formation enzyme)